ncbi:hypothetical protein L210DRAFT_3640901 [Boletus edulis BED1]|uniref:Transmembrane protein n=1 Tax=Boletus edulis BED1 TaxID=1328754 RepID=A0AAD4C5F2_BOLED|nr:hypothetical protein L210DRAFT_3640901 [Boletus edulis BED1]
MVPRFSPSKQRLFGGKTSLSPPPDDIPLSQMDMAEAPLLQDPIDQVYTSTRSDDNTNKQRRYLWRFFCYFLHLFLVALHIVLLVISACNHAEHRITLPFDNKAFTTGLSVGLQAFYILYTTLLVFVTQSLVLSATFSSKKKLTQIHDICSAWSGLGAALSTLWSQTKVASSVWSVVLVAVYFACVSVLHVASSTIMQFQPFNHTITRTVPAVATWPGPSINLSMLDWSTAIGTLPFLRNLYGNTTNGLANNTLYDIPTQSFAKATVNTTMVNAHCGLLTNLSVISTPGIGDSFGYGVNVSMTGMDPFTMYIEPTPLLNGIWFDDSICDHFVYPVCNNFILYLLTAKIEADGSVNGVKPVYFNGSYGPARQNISVPMYFVACTLNVSTNTATLDTSGSQFNVFDSDEHPTDEAWSNFSPGGDTDLTATMVTAMSNQNVLTSAFSVDCLPVMTVEIWIPTIPFRAYMKSLLGLGQSSCNMATYPPQFRGGASLADYTGAASPLTRGQMERIVSRIATEFIWIAGELGSAGGGFDRWTEDSQIIQYILQWRLNINPLPVIAALCASVILCVLAVCMLWNRHSWPGAVSNAGVLEIMWLGSRSRVLRDHLRDKQNPSVDSLRASSMFESVFWTRPAGTHVNMENRKPYAAVPLYDLGTHASSARFLDSLDFVSSNTCTGDPYQLCKPIHVPDTSRSRHWCYGLHIMIVALHVVLLVLLIHHPEHSVVIPIETNILTTGLSALLQAVYTLYSAILVVITQQLALFRIVGNRRKLTTIHDVSGAWTGIGAAMYVLWRQRQVAPSILEIIAVVTYLTSMLILHVGSSSIMQWQVFNSTLVDILVSDLAFPGSTVNISQLQWEVIFPVLQSISLDTGVSTYGLSNNIIYDMPQVPTHVAFLEASVNATTISVQCGLVPNLTFTATSSDRGAGLILEEYHITFSQNGSDNGSFTVMPMWKDLVLANTPDSQCIACPQTLFYIMTTGIDVDESILDTVAVNMNWTYTPSGGEPQNSTTLTHIAACSVSAQTVPATLNLQENQLHSTTDQTASSSTTSWSTWSPGDATDFSVGVVSALTNVLYLFGSTDIAPDYGLSSSYTKFDWYMMSLLGINATSAVAVADFQSSANPSVKLSPSQLEDAIAQTIARFLWLSGQLGEAVGGFQRTVGESRATRNVLQWRLNLNMIPIVFASVASFIALILVPFIIGKKPSKEHAPLVTGTSVLECLWLEAQSEALDSWIKAIEEPRSDSLRAGGMFDVSLGDIGRSSLASEAVD